MLDDLLADLASNEIPVRVQAVAYLAEQPDIARPRLTALVADPSAPSIARVWATIALCHVKDDAGGSAALGLVLALDASEAVVRWSALRALGALRSEGSAHAIAMHLDDHEEISDAWFEDDCRPSQAAKRALELIGTPVALDLLKARGAG